MRRLFPSGFAMANARPPSLQTAGVGLALCVAALLLAGCGQSIRTLNADDARHGPPNGALMSYAFARAELTFNASFTAKSGLLTISADPIKALPDFAHQHELSYSHGALSTDDVAISLDNGMLKKISSTTTDQTVDAVKAANALLTQVAATQTALSAPSAHKLVAETPTYKNPCGNAEDIKVSRTVDVTYDDRGKLIIQQASSTCTIRLDIELVKLITTLGIAGSPRESDEPSTENICNEAVCFRLAGAYRIKATATLINSATGDVVKMPDNKTPIAATADIQVMAPQRDAVGFVRFNRHAFVANSTSVSFTNGIVSDFTAKDPSEIVGFLSLPTELLKTVVLTVPLVK